MPKQTAVEWLIEHLKSMGMDKQLELIPNTIEWAKHLEKEQIKQGYIMALLDRGAQVQRDSEDYYNQTFKINNND